MTNSFWVIFDTSTRQAYYQDVHNVLALPLGTIIRYDYRENWLSEEAKRLAANKDLSACKVLLVYAQWIQYKRKDQSPNLPPPHNEIIFVATRLAEMQPIVVDGIDYFFDLKLAGYPAQIEKVLTEIIQPLADKGEVPYFKWVAISDRVASLNRLSSGKEDKNWQAIIDRMGNAPLQFAGDSFWRLRGVFQTRKGLRVNPDSETEYEMTGGHKVPRKTFSFFSLYEGQSYFAELLSYAPRPLAKGTTTAAVTPRIIRLTTEPAETVAIESDTTIDLRSYTGHSIRLAVKSSERIAERSCKLSLRSNSTNEEWPTGPNTTIFLRTKKKTLQLVVSALCGIAGTISLLFATKIWDKSVALSIAAGAIGTILVVAAFLLYARKLSFKP